MADDLAFVPEFENGSCKDIGITDCHQQNMIIFSRQLMVVKVIQQQEV